MRTVIAVLIPIIITIKYHHHIRSNFDSSLAAPAAAAATPAAAAAMPPLAPGAPAPLTTVPRWWLRRRELEAMGKEDKKAEQMAAWAEATLRQMREKAGEEVAAAEWAHRMAAWEARQAAAGEPQHSVGDAQREGRRRRSPGRRSRRRRSARSPGRRSRRRRASPSTGGGGRDGLQHSVGNEIHGNKRHHSEHHFAERWLARRRRLNEEARSARDAK